MYKYKCECGYSGDYLVPYFRNNTTRCPFCSKEFKDVKPSDVETVKLKCPYCKKECNNKTIKEYMSWKTCEHCGKNFEAKKRVRYFIK